MKRLILLAVLLPLNASALICQDTGSCADKRLNQTYELKKVIREEARETRKLIRREHYRRLGEAETARQNRERSRKRD